jgi:hypothetical protein
MAGWTVKAPGFRRFITELDEKLYEPLRIKRSFGW